MRLVRGVLALCAAAAVVVGAPPSSAAAEGGLVTVQEGELRGRVDSDGRRFLGVPYAAPPTGERRFRPPRPAPSWSGVRDARREGDICPQASLPLGGEDCLVLNVHTPPATASRDLPVMVFIPGGAYNLGWGSMYDPAPLVAEGVIVVTMNYRVGPLGFLALPGLAEESGTTGNWGILDQQAALRWVRGNVGAFGGDAGNVTVFGESAGGHSVCMQLISPAASGLFHKAVSQSGGCVGTDLGPVPAETAYERGEALAKAVGCTDAATMVDCLRGKPVGTLQGAAGDPLPAGGLTWVPAIDGKVINEPARAALAAGRYHKVPLISGSNKDEGRLFVALQYHLGRLRHADAGDLEAALRLRAGGVTPELRRAYPPASDDNADLALSAVLTDSLFACPALFTDRAAVSNAGQRVYAYEFADPDPPLSGIDPLMPLDDYHAAELFYLFEPGGLTTAQRRLADQMLTYWTSFAKTGDPNTSGVPAWPAFTAGAERMQRLSSQGTAPFTTFATDHKCRLWE